MKKIRKLLRVPAACLLLLSLCACGSPLSLFRGSDEEEPSVLDLTGYWMQSNSPSDTDYQAIYIHDKMIEIYWIIGNNEVSSGGEGGSGYNAALYWAGTYQAPDSVTDHYTWKSTADKARTTDSLLTTSESSKDFEYIDGQLFYTITVNEQKTSVYADRGEWDYDKARKEDTTEINYYDFMDTQYALIKDINIKEVVIDAVRGKTGDIRNEVVKDISDRVNAIVIGR